MFIIVPESLQVICPRNHKQRTFYYYKEPLINGGFFPAIAACDFLTEEDSCQLCTKTVYDKLTQCFQNNEFVPYLLDIEAEHVYILPPKPDHQKD